MHHADEERTYHIVYQLAADDDVKAKFWSGLEDTDQESFWYVGFSEMDTIEGETDAERFQSTLDSLALIGITGERLKTSMRAICIVLQLGNNILEPDPNDDQKSVITSTEDLQALADVMGIKTPSGELDLEYVTASLTIRTVTAKNEEYKVPLRAATAKESVDIFGKDIYAKTFLWLVRAINDATCAERNYTEGTKKRGFGTMVSSRLTKESRLVSCGTLPHGVSLPTNPLPPIRRVGYSSSCWHYRRFVVLTDTHEL